MPIHSGRKAIAVYAAKLSGFYMDTVSSHLRKECYQRGLDLIHITTSGFGEYHLPLALDYIDGVYLVLNPVSSPFVNALIQKDIPVVSTTEDYFPLNVEVVRSDQNSGVQQAFDHLFALGHRRIGFAGMLEVADFRLRYEALLQRYRDHNLEFQDDWLYRASASTITHGAHIARQFKQSDNQPSAMVVGSDQLALGIQACLINQGIRIPEDLALVSVDNSKMATQSSPGLTSADQGLEQMVSLALDRLEARMSGSPYQAQAEVVSQTLHVRQSCGANAPCANIQPARALEMQDHNQMALATGVRNLNWLLGISNVWGPLLSWAGLAAWSDTSKPHIAESSISESWQKLKFRELLAEEDPDNALNFATGTYKAQQFPPFTVGDLSIPEPAYIHLVAIQVQNEPWGVLAVVNQLSDDMDADKYGMLNYYTTLTANFMEQDALDQAIQVKAEDIDELSNHLEALSNASGDGVWVWNLDNNATEWNTRLLKMLGFENERDQLAYSNMPILERIHPQDQPLVKELFRSSFADTGRFRMKFRIQKYDGDFLWVEASGEAIREPDGHICRFIGTLSDISEHHETREQMAYMARHDPLTGLPNRGAIMEEAGALIRSHQHSSMIMFMCLNLNRFKLVNVNLGHHIGDMLLTYVSKTLEKALRKTDLLSRVGGDEFVLVCPVQSYAEAQELGVRIMEQVNGTFHHGDMEIPVTCCLGYALYPDHHNEPERLLHCANLAMTNAKQSFQELPAVFEKELEKDETQLLAMESHLRRGLHNRELYLVFQPIVEGTTGKVTGAEALARWESPVLGSVPPGVFIELAENIGLIQNIGAWVIQEVLNCLKRWQSLNYPACKVSLNVSATQLHQPNFAQSVIQSLQTTGVHPGQLNLEITESAAVQDFEHARVQLEQLAEFGVQISLDDFGTGYSSLRLLKDLPLHWVKIDRSFVKTIETSDANKNLVSSISQMCSALGYQVVAEGVETEQQLQLVNQMGCHRVQGYLFSKPVPIPDFEESILGKTLRP